MSEKLTGLGKRIDREVLCSLEHMTECRICHKLFDLRDLSQVVEHEHTGVIFAKRSEVQDEND